LIDNESTDGTREKFRGQGLIDIEKLPWTMEFSLSDQLRGKQRVFAASNHDRIVHADADEWLCSPIERQSLLEGLTAAEEGGSIASISTRSCSSLFGTRISMPTTMLPACYFFQPHYPRVEPTGQFR
jgi:hypothetical protein